jgi:MerR family transcriptional regulator, heat shock protein HspR
MIPGLAYLHLDVQEGVNLRKKAAYMISAVAETYEVHPQTLRLYERLGLLKPSRSEGNTRLYTEGDLQRLEVILTLTRDLGVNLAGVEVILNMREKMEKMQREVAEMIDFMREHLASDTGSSARNALVPVPAPRIVRRGQGLSHLSRRD